MNSRQNGYKQMKHKNSEKKPLNILYLEDSLKDVEIIQELLDDEGFNLRMDYTDRKSEYVSLLNKCTYDVILSDFKLPGFDAFGALQLRNEIQPATPFICVSGSIGEEIAIELIKHGTVDYVLKDRMVRLPSAINRALDEVKEKELRRRAEKTLSESEERYRLLFESSMDAVLLTSPDGEIFSANSAACKMFDRTEEDLCRCGRDSVVDKADPRFLIALEIRDRVGRFSGELTLVRHDGSKFPAEVTTALFKDREGRERSSMIIRDITERKYFEEQLRQIQKLEGLGTLAGGIAHDFNNILGIILAYVTNINLIKNDSEKLGQALDTILKAIQRGRGLVQQILTFARKTETKYDPVNVNDVVREIMIMILETFPKIITCNHNFDERMPPMKADRSQLHQAVLNLCVNARDAMPKGGALTISTAMMPGDSVRDQHPDAKESNYICIEVSDTGEGMTEEVRKRIFEPFFTTKEVGKGTGLGLAVVFGVVEAHNGFIDVVSEPGRGAIFRLFLPSLASAGPARSDVEEASKEIPGGVETLLIVEDEEPLLEMLQLMLVDKGYTVLSAEDGMRALNIYQHRKNDIHLVITDFGLPKITGLEVCRQIRQINPNVKLILATGYLDPEIKTEFLKAGIQHFLIKPYTISEVLRTVREALERT